MLKTVLVVDDDDDTRLLTKIFLNNFGYEVDSADSTSEALTKFNPDLHDLVLTDNSMQGMTGAEMAHIIKLRSPATPVVMYTGNPPNNCSSVDVLIKKPTYLLAIKDAIEKLLVTNLERAAKPSARASSTGGHRDLQEKGIGQPAALMVTTGGGAKFRVLVVDDEPLVSKAIKLLLEHEGHAVMVVDNGDAALALLGREAFDVVLTDFCMPGMKGDELVARIKELYPGKPVIMVTAFAEEYELFANQAGKVDALLLKPFTRQALRDAIFEVVPVEDGDLGSRMPPMTSPPMTQAVIPPPGP